MVALSLCAVSICAGVIGLTTALRLQETGKYQVTIVAEFIPSDPKSIKYTSQWAVRGVSRCLTRRMQLNDCEGCTPCLQPVQRDKPAW